MYQANNTQAEVRLFTDYIRDLVPNLVTLDLAKAAKRVVTFLVSCQVMIRSLSYIIILINMEPGHSTTPTNLPYVH